MYSGYVIAFDGAGPWNFGDDFAGNVIIFGVHNSLSSHTDNRRDNFLLLGEGPTYGINKALVHQRKMFIINLSKSKAKFCLGLH